MSVNLLYNLDFVFGEVFGIKEGTSTFFPITPNLKNVTFWHNSADGENPSHLTALDVDLKNKFCKQAANLKFKNNGAT
jgi:hypothetical protein